MGRKHCGKRRNCSLRAIARYEQFLLFPQCFQKVCFPGESKGVIVSEWVNDVRGPDQPTSGKKNNPLSSKKSIIKFGTKNYYCLSLKRSNCHLRTFSIWTSVTCSLFASSMRLFRKQLKRPTDLYLGRNNS